MTGPPFRRLLAYDLRHLGRMRAIWVVLLTLATACVVGARNGSALHTKQQEDAARVAAAERAWYEAIHARVRDYSQPSAAELPYWQDPTDAAGFSRYFLRRHAIKPHLPLSALAVGHSDLQPYVVPVRLEGLFGGDPAYDYEHPRALAVGVFDLAFVLVWLLPLGVAAIVAFAGSYERDQGILPSVAAHPLTPRRWLAARGTAIGLVVIPSVSAGTLGGLVVAGVSLPGVAGEVTAALALAAAQCLFWLALGMSLVARGAGGTAALSTTLATWMVFTVGLPLVASVLSAVWQAAPPLALYIDDVREVTAAVEAERDTIVGAALAAHSGTPPAAVSSSRYDYSTRLATLTPEIERRLSAHEQARQQHARATQSFERIVAWLSPQVALQGALERLAGTGSERHRRFSEEVRRFQLALRTFMYPRILRQAVSPVAPSCRGCAARLNFVEFDQIPVFSFSEESGTDRTVAALWSASWLLALSIGAFTYGTRLRLDWAL